MWQIKGLVRRASFLRLHISHSVCLGGDGLVWFYSTVSRATSQLSQRLLDTIHTVFIWLALWSYFILNFGREQGVDSLTW